MVDKKELGGTKPTKEINKEVLEFESLLKNSDTEKIIENKNITEKDILKFAIGILIAIAVLFVLSAIAYLFVSGSGKNIFDVSTRILTPLATLVLGFYFSRK